MKEQINNLLLKMQSGENCIGDTANKLLSLFESGADPEEVEFNPRSGGYVLLWHGRKLSIGKWDKECLRWEVLRSKGTRFLPENEVHATAPISKPLLKTT